MTTMEVPAVGGRAEAKNIQKVANMMNEIRISISDMKNSLEDQRKLTPERDKKIAQACTSLEAFEGILSGADRGMNDEKQQKTHRLLHKAAELTLEKSPEAGFSYLNKYTYSSKVFRFLDNEGNAPKKAKNRRDEVMEDLSYVERSLVRLAKKLKEQGSKFRVIGKVGAIGYTEALNDVFVGLRDLQKEEHMGEIRAFAIDLDVHKNLDIAASKAKDMARAGIGAGLIAEYLNNYEIDRSKEGKAFSPTRVNPQYATLVNAYISDVDSWADAWMRKQSAELQNAIREGTLDERQAIEVSNGLLVVYVKNNPWMSGLPTVEQVGSALTFDDAIEMNRRAWRAFATYRGTRYMAGIGLSSDQQRFLTRTLTQPDEWLYYRDNNPVWKGIEMLYWNAYIAEKRKVQEESEGAQPPPPPGARRPKTADNNIGYV